MKKITIDWLDVEEQLNEFGYADLGRVFSDDEIAELINGYSSEQLYRSTISMKRYGFGQGEYKYYSHPLPRPIEHIRTALYEGLVQIANNWNEKLKIDETYPATHEEYLKQCHSVGQTRPTPLILKYVEGDYNCLHQDTYGDMMFPIQVVCLLSDPNEFEGGEFALNEQRPRMQSRVEVIPLKAGHAVAFPVKIRPKEGKNGFYRVQQKHGVSRLRKGKRHTLGIIFHDAK